MELVQNFGCRAFFSAAAAAGCLTSIDAPVARGPRLSASVEGLDTESVTSLGDQGGGC